MIFWFLAWAFLSLLFLYFWSAFKDRERRLLAGMREPALDDHHITVWERLPLYDWEAEDHL